MWIFCFFRGGWIFVFLGGVNILLFWGGEYFDLLWHKPKQTFGFAPNEVSSMLWKRDQKLHIYLGGQCWGDCKGNLTKCKQEWLGEQALCKLAAMLWRRLAFSSICCPAREGQNEIWCVPRPCSSGGVRQPQVCVPAARRYFCFVRNNIVCAGGKPQRCFIIIIKNKP